MLDMMRYVYQLVPCCLLALLGGLFLSGPRDAHAQTGVSTGPHRAALAPTAASLAGKASFSSVWMQSRFDAFQVEFSDDFGVARPLEKGEAVDHLQSEVALRWGDTRWFEWVRRCLVLYARVQSLTETERSGFDMDVETDDLVAGKVGVRVSRALE